MSSFVADSARVWAAGGERLKNNRCVIDGGSNIIEEAGIDYMGRSYGVIAPDNLYVVGADADSEGLYAVASRDAPESFAAANEHFPCPDGFLMPAYVTRTAGPGRLPGVYSYGPMAHQNR